MGKFNRGEIIFIPFPFTDFTAVKPRPALVVATMPGNDIVICEITSKSVRDNYAVAVTQTDFEWGGLPRNSNIRANIIMTANSHRVVKTMGKLKKETTEAVIANITRLLGINTPPSH